MASIGEIQQAPDGTIWKMGVKGWQQISDQQAHADLASSTERFAGGFFGGEPRGTAGGAGKIAGLGLDLAGLGVGLGAGAKAAGGAVGRRFARNQTAENVAEGVAKAQAARARLTGPTVTAQGTESPLAGIGASLDAERKATEAPNAARRMGQAIGRSINRRSVGAAAVDESGFPGQKSVEKAFNRILDPRPLSPDQEALLPLGKALGVKFFVGQDKGIDLFRAGAESDALIAASVNEIKDANMELGTNYAAKALGIPGGKFGRETVGEARKASGANFNLVGDSVGQLSIPPEIREPLARFVPASLPDLRDEILSGEAIDGRQLMNLRNKLNSRVSDLFKQGKGLEANELEILNSQLDGWFRGQLSDDMRQLWDVEKARWTILRLFDKPGTLTPEGNISFKVLWNRMNSEMPEEFRRQLLSDSPSNPPAFNDFVNFIKVMGGFRNNINDSGTAVRQSFRELFTSPSSIPGRLWASDVLAGMSDEVNAEVLERASR